MLTDGTEENYRNVVCGMIMDHFVHYITGEEGQPAFVEARRFFCSDEGDYWLECIDLDPCVVRDYLDVRRDEGRALLAAGDKAAFNDWWRRYFMGYTSVREMWPGDVGEARAEASEAQARQSWQQWLFDAFTDLLFWLVMKMYRFDAEWGSDETQN